MKSQEYTKELSQCHDITLEKVLKLKISLMKGRNVLDDKNGDNSLMLVTILFENKPDQE